MTYLLLPFSFPRLVFIDADARERAARLPLRVPDPVPLDEVLHVVRRCPPV